MNKKKKKNNKKEKKNLFQRVKINKAPGPDGAPVPKKTSPSISMTIDHYILGRESTGDNHSSTDSKGHETNVLTDCSLLTRSKEVLIMPRCLSSILCTNTWRKLMPMKDCYLLNMSTLFQSISIFTFVYSQIDIDTRTDKLWIFAWWLNECPTIW